MIERVVVPVTRSAETQRALVVAPQLAAWAGGAIDLLAVVRPIDRPEIQPVVEAAAEELGPDTRVRIVESGGPVEAVLVTELRRTDKELWCIGSHSRSALGELMRDSVSEELVRRAHVPLVLVGPRVTGARVGRVLGIAVDGTERSETILGPAADVAFALGLAPRVLQVSSLRSGSFVPDSSEFAYVARLGHRLPGVEPGKIDFDVLHGRSPARELAQYADRQDDVGMLALATRGLGATQRVLHHSTTFDVARHAPVPVLALHAI
jgi:nucleotide-binding universal stress UspA family protein